MKPLPDQLLILNNLAGGSAVRRRNTEGVLTDAINTQGVGHNIDIRYSTTVLFVVTVLLAGWALNMWSWLAFWLFLFLSLCLFDLRFYIAFKSDMSCFDIWGSPW